jgi:ribose transport system substrate-binding protein
MTHRYKSLLAPAAALTAAALLAACSSASSSSSSSSSGTAAVSPTAAAASSGSTGVAKAQATVTQLEATVTSCPVPAAGIQNVAGLKGKTVYYIPLVQFIPGFVVTAATMKTALAKVGMKLQICNGNGQPSAVAACVQQATGAGAAGIVTDAIPYGMAQNALDAAKAKNIPIIITDQIPPTGTAANSDALTYVPGVTDQPSQVAWWIIASSDGKANAVLAQESDSPSSLAYVQDSLPIYKKYCPDCTIAVKNITATTNSQLASDTSANVLTHPDATYYYTEFEDSLDPTVQGLQQSNKTGISLAVAGGSVDGLGRLKSNTVVKAVVAVDQAYAGWALTDEVLRMATKSPPATETFPSRLFTSANIGTIQVTTAAQATGEWFGDTSYQGAFEKLWGV